MRLPSWVRQLFAGFRALIVLTVLLGITYPLILVAIARIPGLSGSADGSLVDANGHTAGSELIGQSFTDSNGKPLPQYFQSRPSEAGNGYDPTSTSASNLGPENVVDGEKPSLLSDVCTRSHDIGQLEGVDGRRPFCTTGGVGAVLAVFHDGGASGPITKVVSVNEPCPATPFIAEYQAVKVECAQKDEDFSTAVITPIRGDAPATPVVPADAVTASGSGLDPQISVAYAHLQAPRVARVRGVSVSTVDGLIDAHTTGRDLGFLGEPGVNVLELNMDLDQHYPVRR
jgi:K+-transporting ATPase ATPase C chain